MTVMLNTDDDEDHFLNYFWPMVADDDVDRRRW